MIPFLSASGHSLLHIFGWSLLHFLWQGAMLGALLSGILQVSWKRSARLRYGLSCVVFALMLLCPVCTGIYLAAATGCFSNLPPLPMKASVSTSVSQGRSAGISPSLFETLASRVNADAQWVLGIWCAGVLVLLIRFVLGTVAAHQLRKSAVGDVPDALQTVVRRVSLRLKVRRGFQMLHTKGEVGPAVVGWLRPTILLPLDGFSRLTSEQTYALFAHELAHLRRNDYLANAVQTIGEALLFFHPAAWWVSKQIRREREYCCDNIAAAAVGSPLVYARALSLLEQQRFTAASQPILGANGGQLAMRIRRLLDPQQRCSASRTSALSLTLTAVTAAVAFVVFHGATANGAMVRLVEASSEPSPALPQLARSHPADLSCTYYDPAGKPSAGTCELQNNASYCALNGDSKQSEPQIGCAWKLEHARRIAYANLHFGDAEPGSETDRGRIYIEYGRPESIDSHPSGGSGSLRPFEVWHYARLATDNSASASGKPVDVKFVDTCNCGDYKMQPITAR